MTNKFIIVQKSCETQRPIMDISLVNKMEYAGRYDYGIYVGSTDYNELKYKHWMKIEAILKCFDQDYDWIFWSDVDSIIMNFNITLESFVENTNKDLIMPFFPVDDLTKAKTGYKDDYTLNAGNIFIRKSKWAYDFLLECYNDPLFDNSLMPEEAAITSRYKKSSEVRDHIHVVNLDKLCTVTPHMPECMSDIKAYAPGDFIIHFLGKSIDEKIRNVKRYADKAREINNII